MYHSGWIGLRSVPRTEAEGFSLFHVSVIFRALRVYIISLCKVHGPDTSSSTQIKNTLGVITEGGEMRSSSENKAVNMVTKIHSVLLLLVVGLVSC